MSETGTPQGVATRRAVLEVLEQIREGARFDRALERAAVSLSEPDRRFIYEIAAGVLRHQALLDHELAPLARHGWKRVPDPLKDILRMGTYQVRFLDRVPAHAAVSTSVSLAREVGGAKASGFVNALLRSIVRAPRPSDPPEDLATRYSHPQWLIDRWTDRFGPAETEALLQWNNHRPPLVLQPARTPAADIRSALEEAGIPVHEAPHDAGLVVDRGAAPPTALPGYREGAFIVQDPAQALVSRFAASPPMENALVYDACAAPGGKTIALERTARLVIAADRRANRLGRLLENLERAGAGRTGTIVADATAPPVAAADMVLIDAPCTGTGTFARHPDARHRLQPEEITRLTLEQEHILEGSRTAVRPGGLLVYATCSLEPEENQQQVERFLAQHSDFKREAPEGFARELLSPEGDLVLLPQHHGTDGAYAARLRRADS